MVQTSPDPDGALYRVKSGKEATVFCCEGTVVGREGLVAAKVFKPLQQRSFKNDAVYQQGRHIKDARLARAYKRKTKTGRGVQFQTWVQREWEILSLLHEQGASVPEPYEVSYPRFPQIPRSWVICVALRPGKRVPGRFSWLVLVISSTLIDAWYLSDSPLGLLG